MVGLSTIVRMTRPTADQADSVARKRANQSRRRWSRFTITGASTGC